MTKEEKKAIKYTKATLEEEKKKHKDYYYMSELYENGEIETLLNLIKKQQKEIERLQREKEILSEKIKEYEED